MAQLGWNRKAQELPRSRLVHQPVDSQEEGEEGAQRERHYHQLARRHQVRTAMKARWARTVPTERTVRVVPVEQEAPEAPEALAASVEQPVLRRRQAHQLDRPVRLSYTDETA